FAPRHGALAEVAARRALDRLLEPGRELGRRPAGAPLLRLELDARAVRRIALEELLEPRLEVRGVERRRDAQRELDRRLRPEDVAALHEVGQARLAGDRQRRFPRAVDE